MRKSVAFLLPVLAIVVLCIPSNVDAVITSVKVTPASPTTEDEVSIQVCGYFADGCWGVDGSAVDIHGTTIDIMVRAHDVWQDGIYCIQVIVDYCFDHPIGRLDEGIYTLTVVEDHNSLRVAPDTLVAYFQVDTPTAADPGDIGSIPHTFTLQQNQPNPFNAATTIAFSLEQTGYVSLVVYDLLGRKVGTIVDEDLSSGSHTATWDGKDDYGADATTGVYFYRLTAGNQVSSRKMVLLK